MYWYNGEAIEDNQITLDIQDAGLLYGATAFTTLRVYGGSIDHPLTAWKKHIERLRSSIEAFHWQFPDWQRLRQGTSLLATVFPVLRLTIFPDGREWITGRSLPADLPQRQEEGILGWVAAHSLYTRSLAYHKTGNYLAPWLAGQEAVAKGAKEAILVDSMGNWLETSTGNLWGWREGCWYTPALEGGILGGIARDRLLRGLGERSILVRENRWTSDFIEGLEILAYSNCVVEIVPFRGVWIGSAWMGFDRSWEGIRELRQCFELVH
jgi:4-amino-4-deoxychorismate lyase